MNIGFAMCGSFCTFDEVFPIARELAKQHNLIPIFSDIVSSADTRFGTARKNREIITEICGKPPIDSIPAAEPIGPKKLLDVLVIAPCTGNTLAKLAHGIADTPVTMVAKSHLRNARPVVIALSTNDALAAAAENIGKLLARRHYYFVPYGQDAPEEKPTSLIADFSKIPQALDGAVQGKQLQPILIQR